MFAKCIKIAALALAMIPAYVAAQPAAPPNNVDDRFRSQAISITPQKAAEEALLTGDGDLILLRKTKVFTLHGSFSGSYTSNAFLSAAGIKDDGFAIAETGLRVSTNIGQKVTVFADVGALGTRYFKYKSLDYSALTGAIGAETSLGRVGVALSYRPSMIFSRNFGSRQLTQHRLGLDVSIPFKLKRLTIEPSASVERVLSSPSDYRNWSASGQISVSHPLSKKAPIFAFASAGFERRDYDSYFPGLVGSDRIDKKVQAAAGIQWRPRPWANIALSYSFQRNRSTSDVNGYKAHSGLLGLSAQIRF